MVQRCAAFFLISALVIPFALAAPVEPDVTSIVAGVKQTYQGTNSVKADFIQVRHDPITGKDEKLHGRLAFERPRKIRIETGDVGKPMKSYVVSDGTTIWVYSVEQKVVSEMPDISAGAASVGISIDELAKLDEMFTVSLVPEKTPKPSHTLQLVPRKPGPFKSMQLTLSKQKYLLQQLSITDTMDNTIDMSFSMVWVNVDIPDSEFTFKAPAGVQVVKSGGI